MRTIVSRVRVSRTLIELLTMLSFLLFCFWLQKKTKGNLAYATRNNKRTKLRKQRNQMEVVRNLFDEENGEDDGKNSVSSCPMTRSKSNKKGAPKMVPKTVPVSPDKNTMKMKEPPADNEDQRMKKVRKTFKLSPNTKSVDTKAWQIRGKRLGGGLLAFYLQKSVRSGLKEQPYLRTLMHKIENDKDFREQDLGIQYIGRRRDPNGTYMYPTERRVEFTYWYVFVTKEEIVENLEVWLSAVQDRLNEPDIALSDLFKYKPSFAVTSWGHNEPGELLQDFLIDDDVVNYVVLEHNLLFPGNRDHLERFPLQNYFRSTEQGTRAIKKYFEDNLV